MEVLLVGGGGDELQANDDRDALSTGLIGDWHRRRREKRVRYYRDGAF
jgi:hypothetical protein